MNSESVPKWVWVTLPGLLYVVYYLLRRIIDLWREGQSFKRQRRLEDAARQRDLLVGFLNKPVSSLHELHAVGETWKESWRRTRARVIQEWVAENRAYFPKRIQGDLTLLSNLAGMMVCDRSIETANGSLMSPSLDRALSSIEQYKDALEKRLGIPRTGY